MRLVATLRSSISARALLGGSAAAAAAALLIGGAALLAGCASSAGASPDGAVADVAPMSSDELSTILRRTARSWEGTPYRMGGTTRRGIDCSAFTQRLYADALGAALSRSTRTQIQQGRRVSKSNLRPGDLVFFHPGYKTRHVGVYLGRGEFAHASSSQGVTITPLKRAYWQDAYWTARRVLPAPSFAEAPPPASSPPASSPRGSSSERPGW